MSSVIEFAHKYEQEKLKVFNTLRSCKTLEQIETAKRFFEVLKQRWSYTASVNKTINLLIEVDEFRFNKDIDLLSIRLAQVN